MVTHWFLPPTNLPTNTLLNCFQLGGRSTWPPFTYFDIKSLQTNLKFLRDNVLEKLPRPSKLVFILTLAMLGIWTLNTRLYSTLLNIYFCLMINKHKDTRTYEQRKLLTEQAKRSVSKKFFFFCLAPIFNVVENPTIIICKWMLQLYVLWYIFFYKLTQNVN